MNESIDHKVLAIFRELVGARADQIPIAIPRAQQIIEQAIAGEYSSEIAHDIAFHLTDWQADAAFVVAVILFPERFTQEEIRSGVDSFIVHAPNHTAAAAKLAGYPVTDLFEVGAIDGEKEVAEPGATDNPDDAQRLREDH